MSISSLAAAFQPQAVAAEPRPVRHRSENQYEDQVQQAQQQAQSDATAQAGRSVNLLV